MADTGVVLRRRRAIAPSWSTIGHVLRRWPILPLFILVILVLTGTIGPIFAPHNPIKSTLTARNTPPMWSSEGDNKYVLGTDHVGRDVLSRVIHGARVSLLVTAISLTSGLIVGTAVGVMAGYADQISPRFGPHIDEILMRVVEITFAVPIILVALVIVIVFGQNFGVLLGLLAFVSWNAFPRNVRAEVLTLKTKDYVALAKVSGASTFRIIFVHILPGVQNTILVIATLRVGQLILIEAILSFLGAGVPPPKPAWGSMISDGRDYLGDAWWIAFFPGMAIFLVVMALNFLGDWMRDRFDPRLRQL